MNIQEAKQIRIADYLQSLGYTPVKQQDNSLWYKSPFTLWTLFVKGVQEPLSNAFACP